MSASSHHFRRRNASPRSRRLFLEQFESRVLLATLPPLDLVSWYRAEDNPSGTLAKDSADGNDGTLQNGATFAAGEVGQAFSLNGNNQYVLIGDPVPTNLQIQNEITLDAWIYVTAYPASDTLSLIAGSQRDATQSGATIFLDGRTNPDGQTAPPGHIHFQIGDGSFHATNVNAQVPLNQWVHIAATRRANEDAKVYYNGVLQPSTSAPWTGSISYNGAWFAIGQQKDLNRPFNGLIDEAQVFNRALTQAEIQSIVAAGTEGTATQVVTTAADIVNPDDAVTSLREAINASNAAADKDVIGFDIPNMPTDATSSWKAEGNANDSIDGNNGTLVGSASFAVGGKVGEAFQFNADGGVIVPSSPNLNPTEAITIDAWVNPSSYPNTAPAVVRKDINAVGTTQYALTIGDGVTAGRAVCSIGGVGDAIGPVGSVPLNAFTHLACTYDRQAIRLYVNGAQVASTAATAPIPTSTESLGIGTQNGFTDRDFDGLVDEIDLFPRALSGPEVHAIFQAGSAGKVLNRPGLVSWYRAEDNPTDAVDSNTATGVIGAPQFVAAQVGQGFKFDGNDGFIVPDNSNLDFGAANSFSTEGWLRVDGVAATTSVIAEKRQAPSGNDPHGYSLVVLGADAGANAGKLVFTIQTDNVSAFAQVSSSASIVDGSFHYFSAVVNRATQTLTLYLDAAAQQSASTAAVGDISNSGRLFIGSNSQDIIGSTAVAFNGVIDELGIYNRALSPSEIRGNFTAGSLHRAPTGVMTIAPSTLGALPTITDSTVIDGTTQPGATANTLQNVGLIHDYELNGTFADALGGPALVPAGGTLNATNYSFGANQGLSLSSAIDSANDSIELRFQFSDVTNFRKIVDFKNLAVDSGLYNLNTALDFFNGATGPNGSFAANTNADVVLTRDAATKQVVGYFNGAQVLSFTDSSNLAVFSAANNIIQFFKDDNVQGTEASAGVVDRIRLYNGPLTAAQVSDLFKGAPPPTAGDDAVLKIQIDGSNYPAQYLFDLEGGGGSTVKGLVINNMSGHQSFGIGVVTPSNNNTIAGNFLGTDVAGTTFLPGAGTSTVIEVRSGTGNTIGGTTSQARNVIVGGGDGGSAAISLGVSGAGGTFIQGNYIGTNAAGTAALPTPRAIAENGSSAGGNTIGGTTPGAGNVIVGSDFGIALRRNNNVIQGNLIGTNATGTSGLGGGTGILVGDTVTGTNTIGGAAVGAGNVISGNATGISVFFPGVGPTIQGNKIGTDITGTAAIPNTGKGIDVSTPTLGGGGTTTIGGVNAGEGNTIAFNGGIGVSVSGGPGAATILGNSIFSNGGLGIDLGGDGVTPNDTTPTQDADTGPNNLQNFPVMTSATPSGSQLTIVYNVPSAPQNSTYPLRVEFFKADADGQEGKTFLGFDTFNTADFTTGSKTFTFTPAVSVTAGDKIVATATDMKVGLTLGLVEPNVPNNTSEFSANITVQGTVTTNDVQVSKTDGTSSAVPGSTTTYTIVVSNSGQSAATNVTVSDPLPTGVASFSWSGNGNSNVSGAVSDTIASLAPGATVTYTVVATISASATGSLTNTVTIAAANDTNTGNNTISDTDTLTPQNDVSVTKNDGVTSVVPGNATTYTIVVSNSGLSTATNVAVSDPLPTGVTSFSWSGNGHTNTSGAVSDTIASLAPGATVTYTVVATTSASATGSITNTVTVTALNDVGGSNNSATDTDALTPQNNVGVTKTDGVTSVVPGNTTNYTIVVSNSGPSTATNVAVSDPLPTGVTSFSWSGNGHTNSSGPLTDTITSLAPGATVTYTVVATISASATGSLINAVTVTAANDTSNSNNTGNDTDTLTPQNNVGVTKTDGVTTAVPGNSTTYTIVVSNSGPSTATNITVSDSLPAGVTSFSWSGHGHTNTSGMVNDMIASLAPGATVTYTVVATISASATGSLSNIVDVTAANETDSSNNSATDTDTLTPQNNVGVTKTDGVTNVSAASTTTYTIVVSNSGPSTATNISVSDPLPTGVTSFSWSGNGHTNVAGPVSDTIASLAPGATVTYTVIATISDEATGSLTNTVTVTAANDTSSANNTANDIDTVRRPGQGLPECDIFTANEPGALGTAVLQDDADNPGEIVLLVTGTSKNDVLIIEPRPANMTQVRVKSTGHLLGIFNSTSFQHIVAYGLGGNDTIVVDPRITKSAIIFGGDGNDSLFGGGSNDQISGGNGNDSLYGGLGNDTLCGDAGNDYAYGGLGDDVEFGDIGNDHLYGDAGNDQLLGGEGNDFVYGGIGNDQLYGQAGNDQLYGDAGNDIVVGGDGNDKLYGSAGRDILIGGIGADQLYGETGDDILVSGSTIYDENPDALTAILAEWTGPTAYNFRVNRIRFGGGANGAFTLDSATVIDDGATDLLFGGGNQDWFLFGSHDVLKDRARDELVN